MTPNKEEIEEAQPHSSCGRSHQAESHLCSATTCRGRPFHSIVRRTLTHRRIELMQRLRQQIQTYYFRKLARYLQPLEYRRVKTIRSRTGPQISIPELLYLRWAVREFRPEVLVEIGSFNGASTSLMTDQLQRLGRGRMYAIDPFSKSPSTSGHGSEYGKVFDQTMQPYHAWFEKIEGDSKTVPWDRSIDLLFIDGDHSEAGVSADLAKYMPFVRAGGAYSCMTISIRQRLTRW